MKGGGSRERCSGTTMFPMYVPKRPNGVLATWLSLMLFSVLACTAEIFHMEGVEFSGKSMDCGSWGPQVVINFSRLTSFLCSMAS